MIYVIIWCFLGFISWLYEIIHYYNILGKQTLYDALVELLTALFFGPIALGLSAYLFIKRRHHNED